MKIKFEISFETTESVSDEEINMLGAHIASRLQGYYIEPEKFFPKGKGSFKLKLLEDIISGTYESEPNIENL